ncbi:MAG: barstar family protein [Planctomycetaceae bacterium]|nr:barstar family protein [Planctomycetaceae bacterium]
MPLPTGFVFVDDPRTFATGDARAVFVSHRIHKKRELFGSLKRQLGFPDHFGWNWDALNDCLHEIVEPIAIIHDGLPFGEQSQSRRIYLELLRGLVESDSSLWTIVFPSDVRNIVLANGGP